MTFDDDFVRLTDRDGNATVACAVLGLDWPPPERLDAFGKTWARESYSAITDEQRAGMTHVVRGARYRPAPAEAPT